ncbi:DUF763 domain-containing protein [Candidatus Micrarchaeota archaeon]|nr:DUF763 domain-containing protein [Candidatus Micrarchaeota archaeon]
MRTADLPLHPGRCPSWLFKRMRRLAKAISEIIILNYGTKEYLRRLSDPMFFQALGCVLGFDWHSSGITTTVCGALKEALSENTGMLACGGKGKTSLKTPSQIEEAGNKFSFSTSKIERLKKSSKLSAKVDSSAVQDGHQLYHHVFFLDEKGNWTVIQQGLNSETKYARRYHWSATDNFVCGPPEEIAGTETPGTLNLVSLNSEETRKCSLDLIKDNPLKLRKYFSGQTTLFDEREHYVFKKDHYIRREDLSNKDWEYLRKVYEFQPQNYQELLLFKGMGGKKLRALAFISNLIFGTELDWKDPVKYSFSHGGKDGIPYPVDKPVYDSSVKFLKSMINEYRLGNPQKMDSLKTFHSYL